MAAAWVRSRRRISYGRAPRPPPLGEEWPATAGVEEGAASAGREDWPTDAVGTTPGPGVAHLRCGGRRAHDASKTRL